MQISSLRNKQVINYETSTSNLQSFEMSYFSSFIEVVKKKSSTKQY